VRRAITILVTSACVGLIPLLAGCARDDVRTSRSTLEREASRSFKRSYGAYRQMTKGHYAQKFVNLAHSFCHTPTPAPQSADVPWHWVCAITYTTRGGVSGKATYGLKVDGRGCFIGRSSSFFPTAYQIQLRRTAPNPLNVLRGCPDRFEIVRLGEADRD